VIQANPFIQKLFGRRWIAEELTEKEKALFENSKNSDGQWVLDGQTKIISTQTQEIEEQNEKMTLYFVQDLTQQRQLESQVRQSEKLAAVGGLAAGIAHEIRNPLASISGSIELLGSQAQSEDDKTLMKIILKEIDRLNLLISDFLDYAKPEKNPVDFVSLQNLLTETLNLLEKDPRVQGKVRIQRDLQSSATILGDSQKLQQVLMNMLINAVQATEKISSPQVLVSLTESLDQQVLLRIKDNGCGMSEKTKSKLFEPFYTTKAKGTGLGLAMSHKILQSHRCRIVVESQEGLGTEFLLFFPLVTK
jgi:two-component system sensor histidine kinase PilS (NtrC family)